MKEWFHDPNKIFKKDERDIQFDEVLEVKKEQDFSIGQSYSKKTDDLMCCKVCGGDKFELGMGSYHTAIRCPQCKYEYLIHEG